MQRIELTPFRRVAAVLACVGFATSFAGTAQAAPFSVATSGSKLWVQTGGSYLPVLGQYYSTFAWRPQGYPQVNQTGTGPALTLTMPPGIFNQSGVPFTVPIGPELPSYIQFSTQLGVSAPYGGSAVFRSGPKTSRPANFAWCPGATANPTCTSGFEDPGGSQGTDDGLIQYTAGANQFGGTMSVFSSGKFGWWTFEAVTPTVLVRHNNPDGVNGLWGPGEEYEFTQMAAPQSSPIYANPVISTGGLITDPGTFVSSQPDRDSTVKGMPWTTGMIYIFLPFNPPTSPIRTISTTGYDNRTPAGSGNIMMVSGSITNVDVGVTVPTALRMRLNIPEPNRVMMLGAGVGLVVLLAHGRSRLARRGAGSA